MDLENERYATRMTEVYRDRTAAPVTEPGFEFVTEAPIPTVEEINTDDIFFAQVISKEEFEAAYRSRLYPGSVEFPKAKD